LLLLLLLLLQAYKSSQPRNPTSDYIRPDSQASVSLSSKMAARSSEENLLGPFFSDRPSEEGSSNGASEDLLDGEVEATIQECDLQTLTSLPPLDLSWDLLCSTDIFRV